MNFDLKLPATAPFGFSENSKSFYSDLNNILLHHYQNNSYIKFIFDKMKFDISAGVWKDEDLKKIPYLHVNTFKYQHLQSCSDNELALRLTSSGTNHIFKVKL